MSSQLESNDEEHKTQCSFECIQHSKGLFSKFKKNGLEIVEIAKPDQVNQKLRQKAVMANVACEDCESELCGLNAVKRCDEIIVRMVEMCQNQEEQGEEDENEKGEEKKKEKQTTATESVKIGVCMNEKFPCFDNDDCVRGVRAWCSSVVLENFNHIPQISLYHSRIHYHHRILHSRFALEHRHNTLLLTARVTHKCAWMIRKILNGTHVRLQIVRLTNLKREKRSRRRSRCLRMILQRATNLLR